MGKGALIAAVFVIVTTMTMLFNTQLQTRETEQREYKRQANQVARELAMDGRKVVLSSWILSNGTQSSWSTGPMYRDGGRIVVTGMGMSNDTLDFTVLADYDSTVHEVRSRFTWTDFSLNPFQMKSWKIDPSISSSAQLNLGSSLALDDQNIQDLEDILVDDLGLIAALGDIGLDWSTMVTDLETELNNNGHTHLTPLLEIDEAYRLANETSQGIYYPDQINQVVTEFALANPSLLQSSSDFGSLGAEFGISDGYQMLTFEGDLNVTSDFIGKGILVVEGDLIVPSGVDFNWEGIILVKPPVTDLNPVVDFSGNVNIEGMFVSLQEVFNAGHMDVSVMRDVSGVWTLPVGADIQDQDVLKHTHDYTAAQGNYVVFHSDRAGAPNHEGYTKFDQTLGMLNAGDEIFFEIFNHTAHGLGLVQVDLVGSDPVFQSVPAGFDSTLAVSGNVYRTQPFPVSDLEHFDITITRLSSLKKMWDDGNNYPGCSYSSGPHCVWHDFNRYGALTIRLYSTNAGVDKKVYEASLYWHKRTDEDEDFNDAMNDLIADLQDPSNGFDLTIGDSTNITADLGAILNLDPFDGIDFGAAHVGTWHRQWAPGEAGNPLLP